MNSNAGASDKAEIEVIRGTPPPVGMVGVSGEFHITAHHENGEEFYRNTVKNATTTEFLVEMINIFGSGAKNLGADEAAIGDNGIIQAFASAGGLTGEATYGTATTGGTTSSYEFMIGLGTATTPTLHATTKSYTDIDVGAIATTGFGEVAVSAAGISDYTRQRFGIATDAGINHPTIVDPNVTVTNLGAGDRATWLRPASDTGTLVITCVMLVFTNDIDSGDNGVGAGTTAGSLNRLVACADLGASDVDLQGGDTINVRYTYQLAAS